VVGAETLRADDPELTPRLARGPFLAPLRVVVSSDLALPARARVLTAPLAAGTVVATLAGRAIPARLRARHATRARALARRGVRVWELPGTAGAVDLDALCARLAHEGRHDVLVEGGATLASALADRGLVDELWLFVAPRLLGAGARAWAFGDRATDLAGAWRLERAVAFASGPDELFHGYPRRGAARRNGG
jgi:diaminohydroxyphosphoribosylaminopyrimidine deaminase/5-amino-6-(5-phosphoribosylamino)uracil reductase